MSNFFEIWKFTDVDEKILIDDFARLQDSSVISLIRCISF